LLVSKDAGIGFLPPLKPA